MNSDEVKMYGIIAAILATISILFGSMYAANHSTGEEQEIAKLVEKEAAQALEKEIGLME